MCVWPDSSGPENGGGNALSNPNRGRMSCSWLPGAIAQLGLWMVGGSWALVSEYAQPQLHVLMKQAPISLNEVVVGLFVEHLHI